ncbi:hypothetical protein MMAR_3591 [Mycobacterium marinum M]|uniref:Uncharacterized protein n=1 Tax=Mycobacterium marinum (strain ATCC BAA-535 / M) TaxID=216594 RepID=B2HL29_MYCMM|nr:hypothetical protein MMAR_3591 [Mycobacterium marinum M]
MTNINSFRQAVGRAVIYRPDNDAARKGVITSVSTKHVYVQLRGHSHPTAISPEHLQLQPEPTCKGIDDPALYDPQPSKRRRQEGGR